MSKIEGSRIYKNNSGIVPCIAKIRDIWKSTKWSERERKSRKNTSNISRRKVQTDNGFEFTNRLNWNKSKRNQKTMFEETLEKLKIKYRQIKPYIPKENGKVERSHRKDQERFYYKKVFYSLEDLRNRGKDWRKEYNNFPMRPLGWLSPNEFLRRYKSQEESLFAI